MLGLAYEEYASYAREEIRENEKEDCIIKIEIRKFASEI